MKMELSFCFNTIEPDVSHTVSSLWRHFFIWYNIMGLYDDCEYVKNYAKNDSNSCKIYQGITMRWWYYSSKFCYRWLYFHLYVIIKGHLYYSAVENTCLSLNNCYFKFIFMREACTSIQNETRAHGIAYIKQLLICPVGCGNLKSFVKCTNLAYHQLKWPCAIALGRVVWAGI